jgi:hypothetical protein
VTLGVGNMYTFEPFLYIVEQFNQLTTHFFHGFSLVSGFRHPYDMHISFGIKLEFDAFCKFDKDDGDDNNLNVGIDHSM